MGLLDRLKELADSAITQFSKFTNENMMKGTMSGLAMIMNANGEIKDEEMNTMTQIICRDPDLKCYDFAEMIEVFNHVIAQFKLNKFVGEGVALSNIGKIKDKAAGRALIGKICAIAAADGDFDGNEKKAAKKICEVLGIHPKEFDLE